MKLKAGRQNDGYWQKFFLSFVKTLPTDEFSTSKFMKQNQFTFN